MRVFTQTFGVKPSDIDVQQRVSNLRYLEWLQDIAVSHSAAEGWDMARYDSLGQGWVVRRHTITYRRPALLGDSITVGTWIASFAHGQCERRTLFWRPSDSVVLAEAATCWVYIDMHSGRPVRVPEALREAFVVVEDADEALRHIQGT